MKICITIDGDLYPSKEVSKKAIDFTMKFFDFFRLKGKVTWFINEGLYSWTMNYKEYLRKIKARNDEIALHVHKINEDMRNGKKSSKKELMRLFKKDKNKIEHFIKERVVSFRSGAHAYTKEMFEALQELNFKYDSSIVPEEVIYVDKKLYPKSKSEIYVDNRKIKISSGIFKIGKLIEIPNHVQNPIYLFLNFLFSKNKKNFVVCYYLHPADLINNKGKIRLNNILKYSLFIIFLRVLFLKSEFKKINQICFRSGSIIE